jgi:antitoxin HicB
MVTCYALFEPADEGGFVVTFPDFGWGVTQGDTDDEAMEMATDALRMLIIDTVKAAKPLPVARKRRGRHMRPVSMSALDSAKVELYQAFQASGLRKSDLAQRLHIPRSNLDRLFDLHHHSRLDQLEAACAVLRKKLLVSVADAA